MPDRQPFVYIIRDTDNNKRYGGVKFAKGCKPTDLLTTYFTSSKTVKDLISNGRTFVVEKVVEFDTKEDAIEFEELLLQTADAVNSDNWYNQTIGRAINPQAVKQTCLEKYGVNNWMHTDAAKQSGLGFKKGNTFGRFKRDEETRRRMSIASTGRVFSEEHRKKLSASRTGKTASDETKLQMSISRTRGLHPRAIKLTTPLGHFDCINDAAEAHGVTSSAIRKWFKTKPNDFKKVDQTNNLAIT